MSPKMKTPAFGYEAGTGNKEERDQPNLPVIVVVSAATAWLNVRCAHVSLRRYIADKFSQTCP